MGVVVGEKRNKRITMRERQATIVVTSLDQAKEESAKASHNIATSDQLVRERERWAIML